MTGGGGGKETDSRLMQRETGGRAIRGLAGDELSSQNLALQRRERSEWGGWFCGRGAVLGPLSAGRRDWANHNRSEGRVWRPGSRPPRAVLIGRIERMAEVFVVARLAGQLLSCCRATQTTLVLAGR